MYMFIVVVVIAVVIRTAMEVVVCLLSSCLNKLPFVVDMLSSGQTRGSLTDYIGMVNFL